MTEMTPETRAFHIVKADLKPEESGSQSVLLPSQRSQSVLLPSQMVGCIEGAVDGASGTGVMASQTSSVTMGVSVHSSSGSRNRREKSPVVVLALLSGSSL